MDENSPHSFDKRGFWFFIKICFLFLVIGISISLIKAHVSQQSNLSKEFDGDLPQNPKPAPAHLQPVIVATTTQTGTTSIPIPATTTPVVIIPKTIAQAVPTRGKFIGIDLPKRTLVTYKDGIKIGEYIILSIGKEAPRSETFVGSYSVRNKEKRHLSISNKVYLPFSMQFATNFFIHGWPTSLEGQELSTDTNSGSIRLATPDAEKVFEFASIKTFVYIYDPSSKPTPHSTIGVTPNQIQIRTTAEAYMIADIDTKQIFLESNSEAVYPIASVTKLMTAIVANESIIFDKETTITQSMLDIEGETGGLRLGESFSTTDLLYPLLLESSNDAAEALAQSSDYNNFIGLMNAKAQVLGMDKTKYSDPSGLDPRNVSNATNLFTLARHYIKNEPLLLSITKTKEKTIATTTTHDMHKWVNTNGFVTREDFLGGKTGRTDEAKESMISIFKVLWNGSYRDVAVIVLRSDDRIADTQRLMQWLDILIKSGNLLQ